MILMVVFFVILLKCSFFLMYHCSASSAFKKFAGAAHYI